MYLLVLEVLFTYIDVCCFMLVDLCGFMLILVVLSYQTYLETHIYACMFSSAFWCHMLILGSILAPIGIKRVLKVNQQATKMHPKTIWATCRFQERKNELQLIPSLYILAPLGRFVGAILIPLDFEFSVYFKPGMFVLYMLKKG